LKFKVWFFSLKTRILHQNACLSLSFTYTFRSSRRKFFNCLSTNYRVFAALLSNWYLFLVFTLKGDDKMFNRKTGKRTRWKSYSINFIFLMWSQCCFGFKIQKGASNNLTCTCYIISYTHLQQEGEFEMKNILPFSRKYIFAAYQNGVQNFNKLQEPTFQKFDYLLSLIKLLTHFN
jgi:hypothetical protein